MSKASRKIEVSEGGGDDRLDYIIFLFPVIFYLLISVSARETRLSDGGGGTAVEII